MSANDPELPARGSSDSRRRRHMLWYGEAVLAVVLVVALVQLLR